MQQKIKCLKQLDSVLSDDGSTPTYLQKLQSQLVVSKLSGLSAHPQAWANSFFSKLCSPCTPPSRCAAGLRISKRKDPEYNAARRLVRVFVPMSCRPCLMPWVRYGM